MEKSEIKGFIAKRCAKELKDGDVVNLGIGLPTMIPNYLPEGVELIIHAELGIVSAGKSPKEGDANYDPYHVVDAGGSPSSVAYGGGFIDSAANFGLIRGGHVDACFLGALPLTASHCVNKIITEMCVMEVTDKGLVMTEINPEFTVDDVKAATACPIIVAEDLKSMID